MAWRTTRCKTCNAEIIWGLTVANQRRMPVDAQPLKGGNCVLVSGNDGPEIRVLDAAEAASRADDLLYVSHFSTCPQAGQHRRQR